MHQLCATPNTHADQNNLYKKETVVKEKKQRIIKQQPFSNALNYSSSCQGT